MPLSWKIEYTDPAVGIPEDISAKCDGFSVTARMDSFVREMTLDILDKAFYDGLDFDTVPADPAVEIFTKTADTWVSQGKFFLERPSITAYPRSDEVRSVWGRSETARLAAPFADRITKVWEQDTTFFAVAAELCTACGLTFDENKSDVVDFTIFARTFEADQRYPAEILSELCTLAGAVLSCDRTGDIFIRAHDYSPSASDAAITDADIQNITETPIYPAFGNRVKIMPTGAAAGYSVELYVADPCLSARTTFKKPVFARVTDADGNPVENIPVEWSLTYEGGVQGLAKLDKTVTNTQTIRIFREKKRATSFYKFSTDMPAASILGVYAFADAARDNNFAAGGVTISGTEVTLTDPLEYCDQTIVVDYTVAGVAVNYLVNNGTGTLGQTATLAADVEGQSDEADIYINNGCRCPVTLTIRAAPSSIPKYTTCDILVYAEESGGPVTDGRQVFLQQSDFKIGFLENLVLTLGHVAVDNEQASVVNVIAGVSQVETSMHPSSVYGVWQYTDAGEGPARTGDNLYASHTGKVIALNTYLPTGTPVVIAYWAYGSAKTLFRGGRAGTTRISAMMASNSEEGVSAYTTVSVYDPASKYVSQYTPYNWSPTPTEEPDWDDTDFFEEEAFDEEDPAEPDREIPCEQMCEEQYPEGEDRDQCIEDCEESNDPSASIEEGEGFDETDDEADCEGQECPDDQVCCATELMGERGCHPESECFGSAPQEPALTCEEQCQTEFDAWGTTGVYDDGSMRPIDQIVKDDYGYEEGSPGYWEKYDELKAAALQDCLDACEECEDVEALSTDAPETMSPDSDAYIVISGGKGPFTVNLTEGGDNGFSVAADGREIVLSQEASGCGSAVITITDACGQELEVGVRSTNGGWVQIGDELSPCPTYGPQTESIPGGFRLLQGKYKIDELRHRSCSGFGPGQTCDNNCNWEIDPCIIPFNCPDPYPGTSLSPTDVDGVCCQYYSDEGVPAICCRHIDDRYDYEWMCP